MPIYRDLPYIGPPRWYGNYYSRKKLVVIHSTQNDASAEGEARYAKTRSDAVSSHYYVDDDSIVQSLNTDKVAYHAGNQPGNRYGISYEFTGFASWSRERWLRDPDDIHQAGRQMARDAAHWNIPVRWLTVSQLRDGWAGFTTHNDVRRAWGGTHTDPGPGFPRDVLLEAVRRAMGGDDMPIRTSLGKDTDQHLTWGDFTVISWDKEFSDPSDSHANGVYPGYVPDTSGWIDSQVSMRIRGLEPGDAYQVQYQLHDWSEGEAEDDPWTEIVTDMNATGGDQFVTGTISKYVPARQHLWVAVAVFPSQTSAPNRPDPAVINGRWTIAQDRN